MKEPVSFFVFGKPQPAGSKRAFCMRKGGAFTGRAIVTDANPKSRDWKTDVRREAERCFEGEPWKAPIHLTLNFILSRPKNHYRTGKNAALLREDAPPYPVSKPDATKLCRGVEDALTGILWTDDALIVSQRITKAYGAHQGVLIEMREAIEWLREKLS